MIKPIGPDKKLYFYILYFQAIIYLFEAKSERKTSFCDLMFVVWTGEDTYNSICHTAEKVHHWKVSKFFIHDGKLCLLKSFLTLKGKQLMLPACQERVNAVEQCE